MSKQQKHYLQNNISASEHVSCPLVIVISQKDGKTVEN